MKKDFSEVGHTGGKVTFTINCDEEGNFSYKTRYEHSSPRPSTLVGVYAHPDGFACGNIQMGGIGDPWNQPPLPNCIAVMMASDSEGRFGHECPDCHNHFRSSSIPSHNPLTCPYCGLRVESFHFLTPPQNLYIRHYVDTLLSGFEDSVPGETSEVIIDMDNVADSVTENPRPDFYYTSTKQQTEFICNKCNCYNDIRGKYGYCSSCGWRNNAASLRSAFVDLRERLIQKKVTFVDAVKQSVSEFDSAARNLMEQLGAIVPMLDSRRNELEQLLFHNLDKFDDLLKTHFGMKLLKGMEADRRFVNMMFFRRHIYEHDGGVATDRYVRKSGDVNVEKGVLVRETLENSQRFVGCLNRVFANLDDGFHEILPPEMFCIDIEKARQLRIAEYKNEKE